MSIRLNNNERRRIKQWLDGTWLVGTRDSLRLAQMPPLTATAGPPFEPAPLSIPEVEVYRQRIDYMGGRCFQWVAVDPRTGEPLVWGSVKSR